MIVALVEAVKSFSLCSQFCFWEHQMLFSGPSLRLLDLSVLYQIQSLYRFLWLHIRASRPFFPSALINVRDLLMTGHDSSGEDSVASAMKAHTFRNKRALELKLLI